MVHLIVISSLGNDSNYDSLVFVSVVKK